MNNQIVTVQYSCRALPAEIASAVGNKKILAVCDRALLGQSCVRGLIEAIGCAAVFSDFEPNPEFGSVMAGKKLFESLGCGALLAVGGGSAMDVAKGIKYYAGSCVTEPAVLECRNEIELIAVPTTAGTGSEATRFAVMYYEGEKRAAEHENLVPQFVILDASLLETLPGYQRASTAFDALCHATESLWSVKSTQQSRAYALEAIELFFANYRGYLDNDRAANEKMLACANLAGRAINISETTAAHAMSYKITKLKGLSHGHSAALCLPCVMRRIAANTEKTTDKRGGEFLNERLAELAAAFGCGSAGECAVLTEKMLIDCFGKVKISFSQQEIDLLASSVNIERLSNSPVEFDLAAVRAAYAEVSQFCERNGG